MTLASRFRSSLGGEISSLSAELVSVRLTSAQVLVCFVCTRRYRPVLVWVASSSHFAADLAEGEAQGGAWLVQFDFPPPRIIEIDFVERFKLIILGFVGSIASLSSGTAWATAYTEAVTPLAGRMQQFPGFWLVPIRQDIPIWLCASVSCIAKQQATVMYLPVHWVLLIQ